MANKHLGLYTKVKVERVDGSSEPGGKHDGCEYFALDIDHDPYAMAALEAYANACADELPLLASDIRRLYLKGDWQDLRDREDMLIFSGMIFTAISEGNFENYAQAQQALTVMYVPDLAIPRAAISHAMSRLEKHYELKNEQTNTTD